MTEGTQFTYDLDQRRRAARLAYAALFLLATTALFMLLSPLLASHLIDASEFSLVREVVEYSPFTGSLFCLGQILVAFLFFRPIKSLFAPEESGSMTGRQSGTALSFGLMTGAVTLLLAAPILLHGRGPSALASFVLDHLLGVPDLMLVVTLLFLLPITSEALFRGIFFAQLLAISTMGPALIMSTLLFAWTWQVFTPAAAIIFSLGSGLLFYRTRSLLSCIIANSVFTLGSVSLLVLRALYGS